MKKGETFQHKHFLNPNTNQPIVCKITAIRAGLVYFRPLYGVHEDGTDWLGASSFLTTTRWQAEYGS